MRLIMADPGVNPVENPRPRPEPPRFSVFFWISVVGLVGLVVWGVFIRPRTAQAAQAEPVEVTPTVTLAASCDDPKFCPPTATPTPTGTPGQECPAVDGGSVQIINREVTRLAPPVRITEVVKQTQIVPGDPVLVPVTKEVTRQVQVTQLITTTPGPTWTLVPSSTPGPTQTPWIIEIEVTRIVEVTSTSTQTPTPTETPLPTSMWWTPEAYPAP